MQPSRDNKAKIADEIAKLKAKEPENTKLVILEQELVRAEAENLVAEAQLTNVVSFSLLLMAICMYTDFGIDSSKDEGSICRRIRSNHRTS